MKALGKSFDYNGFCGGLAAVFALSNPYILSKQTVFITHLRQNLSHDVAHIKFLYGFSHNWSTSGSYTRKIGQNID